MEVEREQLDHKIIPVEGKRTSVEELSIKNGMRGLATAGSDGLVGGSSGTGAASIVSKRTCTADRGRES